MRALLVILAAALPGRAQEARRELPPPPIEASVTDDAARIRLGYDLVPSPKFELVPYARAGLLAPFGTPGASYPTLLPSPFGLVGLRLGMTGAVETLVVASHGVLDLKSQSPFGTGSSAIVAEELGRRWGVEIAATAPTVRVPNAQGTGSGHAVAALKTKEYGIVFVDWGRLTPTYTWDTREALRLYQALVGMPAFMHELTAGPDGEPAGTLFTEEGKMFLRELTAYGELPQPTLERIFNDAPQSAGRALERYRRILRSSR